MSARAQSTYRSKGDSLKNEAERIRKRINMYSVIRLILFALVVFLCIRWLRPNPVFAALSSLTAFSLLILFVRLSAGLSARKRMLAELIRINEEETGALEWKYDTFHPGTEYMDPEHPNTSDLDIFGKNSLFQYLERTGISRGRDQLAAWLSKASQADDITRRQEATGELCGELDWRQEFRRKQGGLYPVVGLAEPGILHGCEQLVQIYTDYTALTDTGQPGPGFFLVTL